MSDITLKLGESSGIKQIPLGEKNADSLKEYLTETVGVILRDESVIQNLKLLKKEKDTGVKTEEEAKAAEEAARKAIEEYNAEEVKDFEFSVDYWLFPSEFTSLFGKVHSIYCGRKGKQITISFAFDYEKKRSREENKSSNNTDAGSSRNVGSSRRIQEKHDFDRFGPFRTPNLAFVECGFKAAIVCLPHFEQIMKEHNINVNYTKTSGDFNDLGVSIVNDRLTLVGTIESFREFYKSAKRENYVRTLVLPNM